MKEVIIESSITLSPPSPVDPENNQTEANIVSQDPKIAVPILAEKENVPFEGNAAEEGSKNKAPSSEAPDTKKNTPPKSPSIFAPGSIGDIMRRSKNGGSILEGRERRERETREFFKNNEIPIDDQKLQNLMNLADLAAKELTLSLNDEQIPLPPIPVDEQPALPPPPNDGQIPLPPPLNGNQPTAPPNDGQTPPPPPPPDNGQTPPPPLPKAMPHAQNLLNAINAIVLTTTVKQTREEVETTGNSLFDLMFGEMKKRRKTIIGNEEKPVPVQVGDKASDEEWE